MCPTFWEDMRHRVKISVTVPRPLLAELDRGVRQRRFRSRSAAVQSALEKWARAQRDAEIDAYYDGMSGEERAESRSWAELGYEAMAREPGPPRRPAKRRRR